MRYSALEQFTLCKVEGPQATKFLQGQLTCDVEGLENGATTLGACCDNRGRMVANFLLHKVDPACCLLRLRTDVAELLLTHLNKYRVFFKCTLERLNDGKVLGVFEDLGKTGIAAAIAQTSPAVCVALLPGPTSLPDPGCESRKLRRCELWCMDALAGKQVVERLLEAGAQVAEETEWSACDCKRGFGWVSEHTSGHFIPQMINLQWLDGISFNKGCYTGQEIVARVHYLGKSRKQMGLWQADILDGEALDSALRARPGDRLHVGTPAESAGQIVNSVVHQSRLHVLAVAGPELIGAPVFLDAGHEIPLTPMRLPLPDNVQTSSREHEL